MPVGADVLIDVLRLVSNPTTGTIAPASTPYLTFEPARIERNVASTYFWLPPMLAQLALSVFALDSGVDVVPSDRLVRITEVDGKTPWPSDALWGDPRSAQNEAWLVRFVKEMPPPLLVERWIWVERVEIGGALHRT